MVITKNSCHDGEPHIFGGYADDGRPDEHMLVATDACTKCGDARRCETYRWNGRYELNNCDQLCHHGWKAAAGEFNDADYVETEDCVRCGGERIKRYAYAETRIIDRHDTLLD